MSPTPQVNVRSPNPAEWNRNETLDWLRSLGKLTDEELQSFAVQNVNGYTIAKFAFYPEVYLEYHKKVLPLTIGSFVNLSNRLKELQGPIKTHIPKGYFESWKRDLDKEAEDIKEIIELRRMWRRIMDI